MSQCHLARCQQDQKIIRKEFSKWSKNILLQISLETISKHHLEYDINVFNQTNDEQVPVDFHSNQSCLFCINRQEYLTSKRCHNHSDTIINDEKNSPLDLSVKSTTNINSRSFFDIKSDILPVFNQEDLDHMILSSQMNLDYSAQSFFNLNHFSSSLPIDQYQSLQDIHISQLAKQMAYSRMIQEIDHQRNNKTSEIPTNYLNSPSVLTESIHVNQLLNDIMIRMLNEMFEEQIKKEQQPRASRKGELLFVKKQNNNHDDAIIINTKKQNQHINELNPSSTSSSSTSSVSSPRSSLIHTKKKNKSKLNQSSSYVPSQRSSKMINNNKTVVSTDGKEVRPKRGQYRRYESDQLAKAVTAVLNNEMSVHKAGSYFGVPHSTLEYKVKERNTKVPTSVKNDDDDDKSAILLLSNSSKNNNIDQHFDENRSNDKEVPLYIPVEVEMN